MRSFRFSSALKVVTSTSPSSHGSKSCRQSGAGGLDSVEERFEQGCLSAAAFAGDPVDLIFINLKIDFIDGFDDLLGALHIQHIEGFQLFGA